MTFCGRNSSGQAALLVFCPLFLQLFSYVGLSEYNPTEQKAWDQKLDGEPQVPPPAFLGSTDVLKARQKKKRIAER